MIRLFPGDYDKAGWGFLPFVSHKFPPALGAIQVCNVRRVMLELGIVLLDLWHGRTFARYAAETQSLLHDLFGVRYDIARNWLDISRDDINFEKP
ncbi:uncharacterized protein N7496_009087 [Penicillium cataractarum]|uniref:Uncharacterized protein n=1 Tax=Penicillium cataractarum TaxID=2100454 RepID=A0A9W9V5C7_9EURO|nr:uncharacterized protein N7496_009087 [Penicillium cataractarum]KAJ5369327.1 hypothetical protein N7496_009087 [Penicillium cataractarum]